MAESQNTLITYNITYYPNRKCLRKHCSSGLILVDGVQKMLQKAYYATNDEAVNALKLRLKYYKIVLK